MGYFSIPLARLVGGNGRVIAADVQPRMLNRLTARARRAGVDSIVESHPCAENRLGVHGPVDFTLAFWMVHEVEDQESWFQEIASILRKDGLLFIAEPRFHAHRSNFERMLRLADKAGFKSFASPKVFMSRTMVLSMKREGHELHA